MKSSLRVALVVALIAACIALPGTAIAKSRTLNGTITGLVLYPDGRVASDVRVEAWKSKVTGMPPTDWEVAASTVTGRNGKYTLSVPPGTYRVWFIPNDLETYCLEAYPDAPTPYHGDDVVVRDGQKTSLISVQLDPDPSFIEGYALDVSVNPAIPLAGANMGLCLQGYGIINAVYFVTADENGYYRIGGLKPYDWGVWANGWNENLPCVWPQYDSIFGGLYDWSIETAGQVETLNFDFQSRNFVNLSGTLLYEGGGPVVGATVQYYVQEPDGNFYGDVTATTDSSGYFEFTDVPAGWPPNNIGWAILQAYDGTFQGEFYDNGWDAWGAIPVPIQRGVNYNIGNWYVQPTSP